MTASTANAWPRPPNILTAGHPVKVVAAQLGYPLPANFSRDFKLHFAKRPTSLIPEPFTRPPLGPNVPGQAQNPK